jgi:hypothetical protein
MVFYNNFPMKNDNLSEFLMDSGDNFSTDFQQSESSTQKPAGNPTNSSDNPIFPKTN